MMNGLISDIDQSCVCYGTMLNEGMIFLQASCNNLWYEAGWSHFILYKIILRGETTIWNYIIMDGKHFINIEEYF